MKAPLALLALALLSSSPATNAAKSCTSRKHGKSRTSGSASITPQASATSNATAVVANAVATGTASIVANATTHHRSSFSSSTAAASASANAAASSSSSSSGYGFPSGSYNPNGIPLGFLPDDGSGGGTPQQMSEIVSSLGGGASPTYGFYAQAQSGTLFDGSQLLARMSDIQSSGAIFQPAVMPTGGWWGLTSDDNQQAVAICNVMKQFTDAGIQVWLRFGHEVNYYQSSGTYTGGPSDFQAGWAAVAAACQSIAPDVKMFFTPNIADLSTYQEYYPLDPSTVDMIGVDFYPSSPPEDGLFVSTMQPFYDAYVSDTTKFAMGETGLGYSAGISDRLAWAQQMTSADTLNAMPDILSISWFNYQKGYDFRIAGCDGDSVTQAYLNPDS